MLCYRVLSRGRIIEKLYVRFSGVVYGFILRSWSGNFHKRFHHFSYRRWRMFTIDITSLESETGITENIKAEFLAAIIEDWLMERGHPEIKININNFSDI